MKYVFIFTSIVIFSAFTNCKNNGNSSTATTAAIGVADALASDAVFSYSLQGEKISGGKTDKLLMNNVVIITQGDQVKKFSFFLNDAYKENTETFGHSLRFAIPGKTGTKKLVADEEGWNVELFISTGADGKYDVYGNEAFTVTLDNISSTRITGTFSGKMKQVTGGQAELTIADGKFDVPVRNKGN